MNWAIHAEGIGKHYKDDIWGIRHVSTALPFGTFVGLIGANGAGKSTLIHLLCGLTTPTEGRVATNVASGNELGWCSQHQVIDWYLSVYDNVLMGARFAGFNSKESASLTKEALDLVGLGDLGGRQPDQLSGGQQQRIQIARAIVHRPKILILDEPTTGLDVVASTALLEYLSGRARAGNLVIVSSHDLSLLEHHCDMVLLLANGRMVTSESRDTFLERFAGEEVVEVTYSGDLSAEAISALTSRAVRVEIGNPVSITVKRGTKIGTVTSALDGIVEITDIHRRTPGLKEAYFEYLGAETHSPDIAV